MSRTRDAGWTHDVVVVGAGAAGLTAAGGLARLGLRVALAERGAMGGECLNTGCVPSKALIAAARRARAVAEAGRFGVAVEGWRVDDAAVFAHLRGAIAAIAPHDSAERFEAWGVEVIRGTARFTGPRALDVAGRVLRAPRIVLATGSRPRVPPLPGLADLPFLTNETLFDLDRLPARLLILGAGPIGMEMAQAFRRLGAEVVVVDPGEPLGREEPDAARIVVERLRREGVAFRRARAVRASGTAGGLVLALDDGEAIAGSHLLVAAGRVVAPDALALLAAGIRADETGIAVDRRRRTSAAGVYAIGDCRQGARFTHLAGHEGARIVAEIGFGLPSPVDERALPRVTFTDPELMQVGLTEAEARRGGGRVEVVRQPFADNDRAVVDGEPDGFASLVLRDGRPVGACLVGEGVGELAAPFVALVGRRSPTLWALSGTVLPYPTRAEIAKALAFGIFEERLFSKPARLWAGALAALRRRTG